MLSRFKGQLSGLGKSKAQKLGLRKPPAWSKRELNLLKKLYPSRTAQQIADQIGPEEKKAKSKDVKVLLAYLAVWN